MPGPWRRQAQPISSALNFYFNLKRDARPLATTIAVGCNPPFTSFQSQTRCQAPGDLFIRLWFLEEFIISISHEMPGPWRRLIEFDKILIELISISNEMPGPWRPRRRCSG